MAIRTFAAGTGRELAPERVEQVAVQAARRPLEPRRVEEVRRADLGDPDGEVPVRLHERAGSSRVVEVDVREQQMTHVGELEPFLGKARLQRGQRRRRAAVEECEAVVGLDEVHADRVLATAEVQVEKARLVHRLIFSQGECRV